MGSRGFSLLFAAAAIGAAAHTVAVQPARAAGFDWQRFSGQEVTVMMAEHPVAEGMREQIAAFEAATGIKVNLNGMAEDLYFDRMEIALRGDSGTDVYFLPMDSTAYTQYKAGLIQPLSPYLDDPAMTAPDYDVGDFPIGFLRSAQYPPGATDAQFYAIPASFEAYTVFYNKDLVDKYLNGKLPTTMDGIIAAANTIKEKSKGRVAGAVMRGIRSDTLIDTITGIVYNAWGGPGVASPYNVWFDGDWAKPRMTQPGIVKGLSRYADLMKAGPINIQSLDWPDAARMFQEGRAGFFIDASLFGPGFEDPASSRVAGKVGYMVMPSDNDEGVSYTAHWMWGLGIPARADNPEAGWYFIQWMTNKQNEPAIGVKHGGSARLSTWDNKAYKAALNPEYVATVSEAMKNSRSSVVFREGWSEFALRIVDAIQDMYGGKTPQEAAAAAQEDFLKMAP